MQETQSQQKRWITWLEEHVIQRFDFHYRKKMKAFNVPGSMEPPPFPFTFAGIFISHPWIIRRLPRFFVLSIWPHQSDLWRCVDEAYRPDWLRHTGDFYPIIGNAGTYRTFEGEIACARDMGYRHAINGKALAENPYPPTLDDGFPHQAYCEGFYEALYDAQQVDDPNQPEPAPDPVHECLKQHDTLRLIRARHPDAENDEHPFLSGHQLFIPPDAFQCINFYSDWRVAVPGTLKSQRCPVIEFDSEHDILSMTFQYINAETAQQALPRLKAWYLSATPEPLILKTAELKNIEAIAECTDGYGVPMLADVLREPCGNERLSCHSRAFENWAKRDI